MNANIVILVGRLTRDPELKKVGETSICKFGLATSRTFKKEEKTTFVDCTAFGQTGELVSTYMKKGSLLFLSGRLDFSSWEDKDGGKRSKLEVIAEHIQFGPKPSMNEIREEVSMEGFRTRKDGAIPF
jgi:single-strand DNA-binding protein